MNLESYENSFDGFGLMGLAFVSMYYSAFDGKSSDDIKATVNIINEETGEKTDTIIFPDDMENGVEEEDSESKNYYMLISLGN